MKHSKILLALCIAISTLLSCANDDSQNSNVEIRISNTSSFDYENIIVNSTTFENLNSGEESVYQIFKKAYRYGFVELDIDGSTYTIQPIDYVGETELEHGKYTYQIDANNSQEQYGKLSLIFVED